jgi:hypothetical protein
MRVGDFIPVGQAGQQGYDWANVTGWSLSVTTNSLGSSSVAVNALYLQWGYGPSSFGGVGYNYRQTYYNANTGTESNGTPVQAFDVNYGYLATQNEPTFLRQAAQVTGYYSPDPQVTDVRIYRQGGVLSSDWYLCGHIPNVTNTTGSGFFTFKDVASDFSIEQSPTLVLDNDPPVTSNLVTPLQTTLSASTILPTTGEVGFLYQYFSPQLISTNSTATFVPNQKVVVGYQYNLEQVSVIPTPTGMTAPSAGQFYAILRLEHNQGEPVVVESVPRQPCNLAAAAYGQIWLAGDVNNPGYLYYSKVGQPESFGPENYLSVSSPSDPINAVINWRGTLFAGTLTTWYQIVGGSTPYAQPTGAKHGVVAPFGWTQTENAIWFRSADGLREFRGSDGSYMSLPIEWIYRNNPLTPLPLANNTYASKDIMCFYNNQVYVSYISTSGTRYRLIYDTIYQRFRIDSLPMTAMLWEADTNTFLGGYQLTSGANSGAYVIAQDQVYSLDYDDGGWSSGSLVVNPVSLTLQSPYIDLGKVHYPKQWNALETDVNTQGQTLNTNLYFDENSTPLTLSTASTSSRQKVQLGVNSGLGQSGYRMSFQHTIAVTTAPILYQEDIYAAILAPYRSTLDTYWLKWGTDEFKLVKEVYIDITSSVSVSFAVYADGSTTPYYTFTITAQPARATIRVRLPAMKLRQWRFVSNETSSQSGFQLWSAPQVRLKMCREGSGYSIQDIGVM